jgi:hypothetical protein
MNAQQDYKVGTQFAGQYADGTIGTIRTIHAITDTRVCFNEGNKHFRRLSIKRFNEEIQKGWIKIIK